MIHMRFLLFLTVRAWVLCVIGARGFPARVTPLATSYLTVGGNVIGFLCLDCCISSWPGAVRISQLLGSCCQERNLRGVHHLFFGLV